MTVSQSVDVIDMKIYLIIKTKEAPPVNLESLNSVFLGTLITCMKIQGVQMTRDICKCLK